MGLGRTWAQWLACRWWLIGSLVVLLAVGGLFWRDLQLQYRLVAAASAIRDRDFAAASDILLRSRTLGEKSAQWHYLLARAQRRGGDIRGAAESLSRAERLGCDPARIERQRLLARAQTGAIKSVEPQLAKLLQADQVDEDAEEIYEAMARGYLSAYYVADATYCLDSWSQWQPDNETPRLWLADLHQLLDQHQEAVELYREVLDIQPDHREARFKLARSLAALSRLEEAVAMYQTCLDPSHDNAADAIFGLAEIKRRQGHTEEARWLLYDALTFDLTPDRLAVVLGELGEMAMEERQYAEALLALDQSLQSNPDLVASRQSMASLLTALGHKERAALHREAIDALRARKKSFSEAMRKSVFDPKNAEHRAAAGSALLEQGVSAEAEDWLQSAVQLDPHHWRAHEGLARYYEATGDSERARQHRSAAASASANQPQQADD